MRVGRGTGRWSELVGVKQGQEIIRSSGLNFTVAEGMRDAADKVVAQASGKGAA